MELPTLRGLLARPDVLLLLALFSVRFELDLVEKLELLRGRRSALVALGADLGCDAPLPRLVLDVARDNRVVVAAAGAAADLAVVVIAPA